MNEDQFIQLTTKYLSNEASAEEIRLLLSLRKSERYAALFERINERWNKFTTSDPGFEYDVDRGLQLLTEKIRRSNPAFQWDNNAKNKYLPLHRTLYFRIAASVAALLLIGVGTFFMPHFFIRKAEPIVWNEKATMMGERIIVTLLDGTKITLNADSKIQYPVHFGEESREVMLQGEAYFEILHNDGKPFVVHTGNISTTDIGTKFDIKAFPRENDITVSLEEGKVEVSANQSIMGKKKVMLSPAQQLVYRKEDESSTIGPCDIQKAIGWKDNILIFDNEPLSSVFISLERYFGVKFEIADSSLAGRPVRANIKNESFWTVVKVIEKATGLNSKAISENNELKKIVFYEK
ncbi:MAG: FecR domain-containing protein [Bacteroidota bacterium]